MKNIWVVPLLLLGLVAFASAQEAVVKVSNDAEPIAVQIEEKPAFNLEDAVVARQDYSDVGSVAVLNNGIIVLNHYEEVDLGEELGKTKVPTETAAVQLPELKEVAEDLQAQFSFKDVGYDLIWDEGGETGTLYILLEYGEFQLDVVPLQNGGTTSTATCSATCTNGDCNITCAKGKACIAYCDGSTPVCSCVKKPKKDQLQVEEYGGTPQPYTNP